MTTSISRRAWLQRSAMAAALLPVSRWYVPDQDYISTTTRGDVPLLRLNNNENPYGPGEAARKAMMDVIEVSNRYPFTYITQLKEAIAEREGLTAKHVFVTAGSTEVLGLAGLIYGLHQGEFVACSPTFEFAMLYAEQLGATWARTPLDENFQYDLNALSMLVGSKTKLIFICNPNNPTGIEIPHATLKSFCETHAKEYPVYIDEAYIELSPDGRNSSMASLVDQHPNLIIGRTFSKVHGLAGMRIGYALAHPDTIDKLADFHLGRGMAVSVPGAVAATAALSDHAFESMSRAKIIEGKSIVAKAFDQWNIRYLPSATNFIFFRADKFTMSPQQAMEQEGILIRDYTSMPGWSRVSIGRVEEMELFVKAVGKYLVS